MKSLSGNQIQDLKELYVSIYKSDDQEISETTANLGGLDKKNMEAMKGEKKDITKEKKDEKIEKEGKKKEKPIIINLPNGGTKKIYPASDEYKKIKSGELTTSKSNSSMTTDITNIKKNEKGEYSGTIEKPKVSAMGVDVKKIEQDTKDAIEKDKKKNEVKKKEKPLLSTKLPDTTKLGSTVKPVKPGSARDKMIAKNELRQGADHISNLRNQNADFQRMKSGEITKMDFMKQYPKSQTTKKYNMKQIEMGKPTIKSQYEPYDLVLDYVLSEGHAETVEEAHYVMTQMDEETIQGIIEEQKKNLDELALGTAAGIAGAVTLGAMGLNAIRKQMQNKKKMDQGGQFKPGSTLDNIQKKNQMLKNM